MTTQPTVPVETIALLKQLGYWSSNPSPAVKSLGDLALRDLDVKAPAETWDINWEAVGDIELTPAVNWNDLPEPMDLAIWNRANTNIWWPEKIPLRRDIPSWHTLLPPEKDKTKKVFAGLTLLDSIQARVGAKRLVLDARTEHECAVIDQFGYMEEVHARSYSSIFSTLCSSAEIKEVYRWTRENFFLKKKARIITAVYNSGDPLKIKIASVLLESFLFYSGFFLPMYWTTQKKLMNTGDLIKLIIR